MTFLYRDNTAQTYLVLFYSPSGVADPLVGPEKAPTTIEKKRCYDPSKGMLSYPLRVFYWVALSHPIKYP
jgi:hypothetical protein